MSRFSSAIATAARLIAKNGQTVTWRRVIDGGADDATPWKPSAADLQDTDVSMVFLPENRVGFEFLALLRGTEVPQTKVVGLMAAQDFVPTLKDVVIRDGVPMALRYIDVLAPDGAPIFYTIGFDV